MKNKLGILKGIRVKAHELDPRHSKFDWEFNLLAIEALNCMEPVFDMQEKNWIEKGRELLQDPAVDQKQRDKALAYLKEAVNTIILREEDLEQFL